MAESITRLISFEKIWLRVVAAMTGNPQLSMQNKYEVADLVVQKLLNNVTLD